MNQELLGGYVTPASRHYCKPPSQAETEPPPTQPKDMLQEEIIVLNGIACTNKTYVFLEWPDSGDPAD